MTTTDVLTLSLYIQALIDAGINVPRDVREVIRKLERQTRDDHEKLVSKLAEFKPVTMDMIDAAIDKGHPAAPSEQLLSSLDAAGIYYR